MILIYILKKSIKKFNGDRKGFVMRSKKVKNDSEEIKHTNSQNNKR